MESQAIKAFDYLIDLREKYNTSNGTEGAYIVAVNNSWGKEGLFEEDFPILCGMFNELGKVGIMGIGSTENDQVNTDVFGDIPSDCSSDYLIVVTSTNENDELAVAGWGKENVDLGAPGTNIYSVNKENGYRSYGGGTSYAAPHVTGAIGLLYALPEATFCDEAALSPTDALQRMKRYILDGAKWLPTLNDRTVSGGRLNLTLTLNLITNTRDNDIFPLLVYPNPVSEHLNIHLPEINATFDRLEIYDYLGKMVFDHSFNMDGQKETTIALGHLSAGPYLIQLRGKNQLAQKRFIKMD
jgi:subtilisin family serine protease